jgi:transposase
MTIEKKKENKMGRPSKLSAELIINIQNWLRMGYFVEDAARMAGISKGTLYSWLVKGRDDREAGLQTLHSDFLDSMEKARAEAEGIFLNSIKTAASRGQWQAAAWWLERSFDKWSKPQKIEMGSSEDEPIQIEIKYSGDK